MRCVPSCVCLSALLTVLWAYLRVSSEDITVLRLIEKKRKDPSREASLREKRGKGAETPSQINSRLLTPLGAGMSLRGCFKAVLDLPRTSRTVKLRHSGTPRGEKLRMLNSSGSSGPAGEASRAVLET